MGSLLMAGEAGGVEVVAEDAGAEGCVEGPVSLWLSFVLLLALAPTTGLELLEIGLFAGCAGAVFAVLEKAVLLGGGFGAVEATGFSREV